MGFWEGKTCEYCTGTITEKVVTLHRKVSDHYVLIENIPAGVCTKCGTRYFAAEVLKAIEESIHGHRKADRQEIVPIYILRMSAPALSSLSIGPM